MLTFYERADWMLALMVVYDLTKQAQRLLVLYVARADTETGESHLSQERAAQRLGVSARTVRRAYAELVEKGVITVRHRRQRSSVVTLVRWSETGQQMAGQDRDRTTSRPDNSRPVKVRPRPDRSGHQDRTGSGRKTGQLLSARTEPVTEPENRTTTTAAATSSSVVRGGAVAPTGSGSVQTGQQLSGLGQQEHVRERVQRLRRSRPSRLVEGDNGVLPDGRCWDVVLPDGSHRLVLTVYESGTGEVDEVHPVTDGLFPAHLWEVGS